MKVLAGDIGGTHSRLAIVDTAYRSFRILHKRRFKSQDYAGLTSVVLDFLSGVKEQPARACLGIPCPVRNGRCNTANLPWTVDVRSLRGEIGIPGAQIVNDLVAAAHGLQRLGADDLVTLQPGVTAAARAPATKALLSAGTGLGEAHLTWGGGHYTAHDSEGGHATFAARDDEEWGLARFIIDRFGDASCERVISGPGLVNIYRYLTGDPNSTDDPAAIVRSAMETSDPVATRALDMFASAYGAQAGNLALTVLARGGIYLSGGIAPRIANKLKDGSFMRAFLSKGRLSAVLSRIPVHIVINPDIGIIGAAMLAARAHE